MSSSPSVAANLSNDARKGLAILSLSKAEPIAHLADPLRQTEGLIGSIIHLLGIELAVPYHSTLEGRAQTVTLPKWTRRHVGPLQLIVDSTG